MMAAPPTPEELVGPMKLAIEDNSPIPAMVYLGYANARAVAPCVDLDPHETLLSFGVLILQGEMPFPDWVAVVADTYEFDGETDGEPPGPLGPLFEAGDPRVTEVVYGICMSPDGPTYALSLPYVRNPDRSVTWGEQKGELDVEKMFGRLPEAMRALLGYDDMVSGT